jgi:molybdopterin converting factor small subunit
LGEETLSTAAGTPEGVYRELRARHGFTLPPERVRAAVNGDFVAASATLQEGDVVVFIPPVAGG